MTKTKTENGIKMYFHCKKCVHENLTAKLACGWTAKGLQVWCENHDENLIALDFKGQKVVTDFNPKEENRIGEN